MPVTIVYNEQLEPMAVIELSQYCLDCLAKQGSVELPISPEPNAATHTLPVVPIQGFDRVYLRKVAPWYTGTFLVVTSPPVELVHRLQPALLPGQAKFYKRRNLWEY